MRLKSYQKLSGMSKEETNQKISMNLMAISSTSAASRPGFTRHREKALLVCVPSADQTYSDSKIRILCSHKNEEV
jgi:hypothetical protein